VHGRRKNAERNGEQRLEIALDAGDAAAGDAPGLEALAAVLLDEVALADEGGDHIGEVLGAFDARLLVRLDEVPRRDRWAAGVALRIVVDAEHATAKQQRRGYVAAANRSVALM